MVTLALLIYISVEEMFDDRFFCMLPFGQPSHLVLSLFCQCEELLDDEWCDCMCCIVYLLILDFQEVIGSVTAKPLWVA